MVCNYRLHEKKRELVPNKGKNLDPLYEKRMGTPKTIKELRDCESKGNVDLIAICAIQVKNDVADEAIKALVRMHSIEKLAAIAMSLHQRLSIKALDELDIMAKRNVSQDMKDEAIKAIEAVATGAEMFENRIIADKMLVYLGAKKDDEVPSCIDAL